MRIYQFDEVGDSLHLVPMAARRALDHAGVKLSLEGWRSLPLVSRLELVNLGSAAQCDAHAARAVAQLATPAPNPQSNLESRDPDPLCAPELVVQAFEAYGSLPPKLWQSLTALDRYSLCKVASRSAQRELSEPKSADTTARLSAVWQEIIGHSATSTHLAPAGGVRMINVGEKQPSQRRAVASSLISMNHDAFSRLQRAETPKGDVLGTARIAGIMAAKRTSELIPLCHPLALTRIELELTLDANSRSVRVLASVETRDRTGVEMEALVAASTAALTVYDMLKAFDRSMRIGPTELVSKTGGRSGDYHAEPGD